MVLDYSCVREPARVLDDTRSMGDDRTCIHSSPRICSVRLWSDSTALTSLALAGLEPTTRLSPVLLPLLTSVQPATAQQGARVHVILVPRGHKTEFTAASMQLHTTPQPASSTRATLLPASDGLSACMSGTHLPPR